MLFLVLAHCFLMFNSDLDLDRLRREGRLSRVEHHVLLSSTNDRARELAVKLSADETALVIADEQTFGRGRGANRWWTGPGSLACSLIFNPAAQGIRRETSPLISLSAALSIVDALRPLLPPCPLGLHWPNDVFASDRKLAGILVEAMPDGKHVLGIGLNVNNRAVEAPAELRDKAVSVADLTNQSHSRTDLALRVLAQLWPNLAQLAANPADLARGANRACLQHGRLLVLQIGERRVAGDCEGIADDGALVLRTESGIEKFYSGVLVHD